MKPDTDFAALMEEAAERVVHHGCCSTVSVADDSGVICVCTRLRAAAARYRELAGKARAWAHGRCTGYGERCLGCHQTGPLKFQAGTIPDEPLSPLYSVPVEGEKACPGCVQLAASLPRLGESVRFCSYCGKCEPWVVEIVGLKKNGKETKDRT